MLYDIVSFQKDNNICHLLYLQEYYPSVSKGQKEGALTEEKVLDHAVKMMNIVQECNVTLKWMMLHTTPLSPSKYYVFSGFVI